MEMMLDIKQIWAIFLFEFKMGPKVVEMTHSIKNTFGPGTANKLTVQWLRKNFCKGDKSLEDKECGGQPLEVDNDQLRSSSKLILSQLHEKLPKNSTSTILQPFIIWSKLEGEKVHKWVPHELTTNQKNCRFEVLSSLILHNNKEIISW